MDHNDERDFEEERDVRESLEREGREELAEEQRRRPGDTSAARAANVRRGLERKATELRAAGFLVVTPEDVTAGAIVKWVATGPERHTFERPYMVCTCPAPDCRRHAWAGAS